MKLIISKKDINSVLSYLSDKDNDPCNNCSPMERAVCCGCSKATAYNNNRIHLHPALLNCKVLMDYCITKKEMSDIEDKIASLTRELERLAEDADDKFFMLGEEFEIVD